jgi:hypothetical protein
VNAAAVALIAVVLVRLGAVALDGPVPVAVCLVASVLLLVVKINPAVVLLAAAAGGVLYGWVSPPL